MPPHHFRGKLSLADSVPCTAGASVASSELVINIHKYTPYLVLLLAVMALYLMRATVAG